MYSVSLPSGKKFSADGDQSLVDAAAQAGITLPYSCRNGRCSTCKCKVTGPTKIIFDELGLSDNERKSGWKLACSRSATGNVSLDIEDLSNIKLMIPKIVPAKINAINSLTKDILKVTLRLPKGRKFEFIEGQYIDLIGQAGISRSYSLARYCDGMMLELHVRRVIGGKMSSYLFDSAKVGDLLRINGPRGTFTLRHDPDSNIVFLATGTGIAPVKAMLERIEKMPKEFKPKSVKVIWGMRKLEELYWDPRDLFSDLDFTPVLSQADEAWAGARGHVQDIMIQNQTKVENAQIYACGSDAMIRSVKEKIVANGLNIKNFFSDAFVVSGR